MAGRHTKLTPDVQQRIVAFIRAGAFDWIAARASGIGTAAFYRWMDLGSKPRARRLFREFREEVLSARATARVAAEVETRRDNPLAWLRYGPGRDRPGEPGWTESQEVTVHEGPLEVRIVYVDGRTQTALPASVTGNGDRRGVPV